MIDAIYEQLLADDYIQKTLVGGLYTETEISRQITPDAFDANDELLPTGLLMFGQSIASQIWKYGETQPFDIYLYERREVQRKDQQRTYAAIKPVAVRIKRDLHRVHIKPKDRLMGAWYIRHLRTLFNAYDEDLDCKLMRVSFTVEVDAAGSCC